MGEYICGEENFTIGGSTNSTIVLPVELSGLPELITIEGETLLRKSEFHVSLVCIARLMEKHDISDDTLVESIVDDFCEFTKINNLTDVAYSEEFRLVKEGERKTVVIMCEVSNLYNFFDLINKKYNLSFEYPPTHVTLYTLHKDKGIYLSCDDDLKKLSVEISKPSGLNI